MKILIVDDSPAAIAIAKARLAKEHVEILTAGSGQAGLDLASSQKPDLILLDLDMPEMSGLDVCRRLKEDTELCMIPVIFLSGTGSPEDKVKGLDLEAVDYVTKPFDAFELRARVRAALRTKHLQDLLINYAHIDPLTGLPNRRALADRLQQEWARISRHGGTMAFIMADIDKFKHVNDTYGHIAGDAVLQQVARTISALCRESDLSARYGGEEFAIIAPDQTAAGATILAHRCREEIENLRFDLGGQTVRITASFGVADAAGASCAQDCIEHADKAMYDAKQAGRNTVCQFNGGPNCTHAPGIPDELAVAPPTRQ